MLKAIQSNLMHSKAATAIICQSFAEGLVDMALIQEPWVNGNTVMGLKTADDVVAAFVELPGGSNVKTIVCSAYLPGEESDPTTGLHPLVTLCQEQKAQLVVGTDANAHHTSWGSTDTNARGELLYDFILSNDLHILNHGNTPTFVNRARQEVLDITLCTGRLMNRLHNWHVSNEASMSDHRHIRFDLICSGIGQVKLYRDPKSTNWEGYRKTLKENLNPVYKAVKSIEQLESAAGDLEQGISTAYLDNCPLKDVKSRSDTPWWNKNLQRLRQKARRLFNRAKVNNDWEAYREALTSFSKEVRKAKRSSWRRFCGQIKSTAQAARIHKVLAKSPSSHLGLLKKPDGTYTKSEEETISLLAKVHFPDSVVLNNGMIETSQNPKKRRPEAEDWRKASIVFKPHRVTWAIRSFKPFKTGGEDGIFPALLQKGIDIILPLLLKTFRASFAWGYIPAAWTKVKVIFIPKGGDKDKSQPKSYRPISLTSFMLKTMEKVINLHIRESYLSIRPLHINQHAYQKGRSTESALMELVDKLERAIEDKEIALCAFLDIEGAFDNTSMEVIISCMTERGIDGTTINWIEAMLSNRTATITLLNTTVKLRLTRGCPQGGVLSPLEWSIVVDGLLNKLNGARLYTQGYADDLVIVIVGKCPSTISEQMQRALKMVEQWCGEVNLSVNAGKTILVPFTKRRNLATLKPPKLFGQTLQTSREAKYLGITLDQCLTWNKHLQQVKRKAKIALGACCRLARANWGIRPKASLWLYTAIVRPMVTYGCVVWQRKTNQATCINTLNSVQRLACLIATGALSTTPTASMEALLNLVPLHIHVQTCARSAVLRASISGRVNWRSLTMRKLYDDLTKNPIMTMPSDTMMSKINLHKLFKVHLPDRTTWEDDMPRELKSGDIVWYTDGSRKDDRAGAGIFSGAPKANLTVHLGQYATVFQAEMYAIIMCVHENLLRSYSGKRIFILSDSQAALKALMSDNINSKLTFECAQLLNNLGSSNTVTLAWVPGHCGISGNESADELARAGSEKQPIGPEPFCGISKCNTYSALKAGGRELALKLWRTSSGQRHSKLLIAGFTDKLSREALQLSRARIRILTRTLSGHCKLNKHLNTMGLGELKTCRFCHTDDETPIHILCECEPLHHSRSRHLGGHIISPEEIKTSSPKAITDYMIGIGLGEVL